MREFPNDRDCGGCDALLDVIDERDARVEQIERIYAALGGQHEWSNLHDLGDDALDLADRLMECLESVKRIVTDPMRSADAARREIISIIAAVDEDDAEENDDDCA